MLQGLRQASSVQWLQVLEWKPLARVPQAWLQRVEQLAWQVLLQRV